MSFILATDFPFSTFPFPISLSPLHLLPPLLFVSLFITYCYIALDTADSLLKMSYSTPGIVQKAEIRLNGLNQNSEKSATFSRKFPGRLKLIT